MPKLPPVMEFISHNFWETKKIESGQTVRFVFDASRKLTVLAVTLRLPGLTRDAELRGLDHCTVRIFLLEKYPLVQADGERTEEVVDKKYGVWPGTMCQETDILKLPVQIVCGAKGGFGADVTFAPPDGLPYLDVRLGMFGVEARDPV